MSEPNERTRQRLAEVFLPAYNTLHGAKYSNPPEPKEEGQPYDLRWPGPHRGIPGLEVQLIVGPLDPIGDRARPKSVAEVQAAIQDWCNQRQLRGYHVSLGADFMPQQPLDVPKVVAFLKERLEQGLAKPPPAGGTLVLHNPRPYSSDPYPAIKLHRLSVEAKTLVNAMAGVFVPQTTPRLREAIDRKQDDWLYGRKSDLVLLVYFDVDGYDRDDVEALRQEAASKPILFREVWGVSLWSPGERADRLWP